MRQLRRMDLFEDEVTAERLLEEALGEVEREEERRPALLADAGDDDWALDELARDRSAWEYLPVPLADLIRESARLARLAENADRCSRFVEARKCDDCKRVETPDEKAPVYRCRGRGCTLCEPVRAARMERFLPTLLSVDARTLKFMTLTVPNVDSLLLAEGRATSILSRCYRELRALLEKVAICYVCRLWAPEAKQRRRWKGWKRRLALCVCARAQETRGAVIPAREGYLEDGSWGEVTGPAPKHHPIAASLRGIEVTWSEEGQWHPHAHVLASMPWTPQEALADAWTAITRELWPGGPANAMGVDVRTIRDGQGRSARDAGFDVRAALRETLKYPTKIADLIGHPDELGHWVKASRGCRFVQATGDWKAWQKILDAAEDLAPEESDEPAKKPSCCVECGSDAFVTIALDRETGIEAHRLKAKNYVRRPARPPSEALRE